MSETVVIVKEWKKFRRYADGAEYYGMSKNSFIKLAKDAKAIYKPGKTVLVNCEIVTNIIQTLVSPLDNIALCQGATF